MYIHRQALHVPNNQDLGHQRNLELLHRKQESAWNIEVCLGTCISGFIMFKETINNF